MKKTLCILLLLFIIFCFNGCKTDKGKIANESSTESYKITLRDTTSPEETYVAKTYDTVYIKMLGTKQKVNITKEFENQLNASKTVTEPLLTKEHSKLGDVFVVYKGSTEQVEFGEIYTDADDNMYIYAFENENKALYKIEEQQTNS